MHQQGTKRIKEFFRLIRQKKKLHLEARKLFSEPPQYLEPLHCPREKEKKNMTAAWRKKKKVSKSQET